MTKDESQFIVLCGPDTIATGVPTVIVAAQARDDDSVVVERFILIPKEKQPIAVSSVTYHSTSLYIPSGQSPASHLSQSEVKLAEAWLKSYLLRETSRETSPEQRVLTPEIYSYNLEEVSQETLATLFFSNNFHDQWKEVEKCTQCSALREFFHGLNDRYGPNLQTEVSS